jgi:hypothetical protein
MEDTMAERAFLIVAGSPEASEALRMYLEGQGEIRSLPPRVSPEKVMQTARFLGGDGKDVVIVSSAPFAYGSGNYLVPTFAFAPEDRGKTLSPEDLLARLKDVSPVAVFDREDLGELASVLGGRFAEAAEAPAAKVVTRHQGLVDFLQHYGVVRPDAEVIAHVSDPNQIAGEVVAGVVPPHLAKHALAVETPPPLNLTPGTELSREEMEEKLRSMGIEPPGTRRYAVLDLEDPAVLSELFQARREVGVYHRGSRAESLLERTLKAVDIPAPLAENFRENLKEVLAEMREREIPEGSPPLFSNWVRIAELDIKVALGADRLTLEHVARIQVSVDNALWDLREATIAWEIAAEKAFPELREAAIAQEAARYLEPLDVALRDFYREAGLSAGRKEVELG